MNGKQMEYLQDSVRDLYNSVRTEIHIEVAAKIATGMILIIDDDHIHNSLVSDYANYEADAFVVELKNRAKRIENENVGFENFFEGCMFYKMDDISSTIIKNYFLSIFQLYNNLDFDEAAVYMLRYFWQLAFAKNGMDGIYTEPNWLRKLVCELADIKDEQSVYDPYMGEGGYFTMLQLLQPDNNYKFFGTDINDESVSMAKAYMKVLHKKECSFRCCNSLTDPWVGENNALKKFDRVITNPPFGVKIENYEKMCEDSFSIFRYGYPSKSTADWFNIQLAVSSLKMDGRAVVITSMGPLFRSAEARIRKNLLEDERDILDALIELPKNSLTNTAIQPIILVFDMNKPIEKRNKITVIDASQCGERDMWATRLDKRNKNIILSTDVLHRIIAAVKEPIVEDGFCNIFDKRDIDSDEYNLDLNGVIRTKKITDKLSDYIELKTIAKEIFRGVQIQPRILDEVKQADDRTHYLLNISDLVDGKISVEESDYIHPQKKWIKNYEVREHDLLVTARGAFKCAVVDEKLPPAIVSGNIIIIRLKEGHSPYVLKYYLESGIGQTLIGQLQSGVTLPIINADKLGTILVPSYSHEEIKKLENHLMTYETEIVSMQRQIDEFKVKEKEAIDREMKINDL